MEVQFFHHFEFIRQANFSKDTLLSPFFAELAIGQEIKWKHRNKLPINKSIKSTKRIPGEKQSVQRFVAGQSRRQQDDIKKYTRLCFAICRRNKTSQTHPRIWFQCQTLRVLLDCWLQPIHTHNWGRSSALDVIVHLNKFSPPFSSPSPCKA